MRELKRRRLEGKYTCKHMASILVNTWLNYLVLVNHITGKSKMANVDFPMQWRLKYQTFSIQSLIRFFMTNLKTRSKYSLFFRLGL